jgi:hypothetical protein
MARTAARPRGALSRRPFPVLMAAAWLLCAGIAAPAQAQGFGPLKYDYVMANAIVTDIDEIGLELHGQTAATDRFIVSGAYQDWEPTDGVKRKTLRIGVGYRFGVRPNLDFVATAHYADNSIDTRTRPNVDEKGIILSALVRGWLTQRFELSGEVMLDNSLGSSTDTVLVLGGQFMRGRNISYGGRLRVAEEDEALILGARFYFGASRR